MKLTKEMLIDWIDRPPSNSDLDLINYIIDLQNNRDKARKMIFDNYGVLDKYGIEMLDDILKGDSDEN